MSLSREPQDIVTRTVLNLDTNFSVEIPTRAEFKENTQRDITSFIDCSKLDDNKTGAGIVIRTNNTTTIEDTVHLGLRATVFQAEVYVVGRAASHLIQCGVEGKSIIINCDSQTALQALDSNTINYATTLNAVQTLNTLTGNKQMLIRWNPAQNGFQGNERAGELAKSGVTSTDSNSLDLPTPRATWSAALREKVQ